MPMLSLVVVIFIIVDYIYVEVSVTVYIIIVTHQCRITKGKTVTLDTVKAILAHVNVFTSG
jgi:hypothetical protein